MQKRKYTSKTIKIDNYTGVLCDHKCNQLAQYYSIRTKKYCCSKSTNSCPGKKNQIAETLTGYIKLENLNQLCDYGCGHPALYIFNNGKVCCNRYTGKCPDILRRNSESKLSQPYKITQIEDNSMQICDYGCSLLAKFQFANGKSCCSSDPNQCGGKKETTIKSNQEKFDADNPFQNLAIKEKIYNTRVKSGNWRSREERRLQSPKIRAYNQKVQVITEQHWRNHQNRLNPNNIKRSSDWHLDHIFSLQEGYRNNVPPEILGHWTNLQLLPGRVNEAKAQRSDKTLNELYSDFKLANT